MPPNITKDIRMIGPETYALVSAYRKTGNSSVVFIGDCSVKAVGEHHNIMYKGPFGLAVNLPDGFKGVFCTAAGIIFVVVVLVDVWHHNYAVFRLPFTPEAIRALVNLPEPYPGSLITAGAVKEIQDRIPFSGSVIILWKIHYHPPVGGTGDAALILHLFN